MVLAYGHRLRLPLAVGIGCLGLFSAGLLPHVLGLDWTTFMERPEGFMPVGLLAFVAPSFGAAKRYPPFASVYRLLGAFLFLWPTLVLSLETTGSNLPIAPSTVAVVYQALGFAASAAAIALGVTRRFQETVYCGFVFFVVHLYVRFFHWWWDWMPRYLFFLILAAVAVGVLVVLRRMRSFMSAWDEGVRP